MTLNEKYIERFYEPVLTEHEFVASLLTLLNKNGVTKIKEYELAKKLYYYYLNQDYKEIFQDICLSKDLLFPCVDIHDGIYKEKFFSGNITWDQTNSEVLYLNYNENTDISGYLKNLSEDAKTKLFKMASELSNQYKIEQESPHKLTIYSVNPNFHYTIVYGKRFNSNFATDLITDGTTAPSLNNISAPYDNEYYEDTLKNESFPLKGFYVSRVDIKNASYVIKREYVNDKISQIIINTEITDLHELTKIMNLANNEEDNINKEVTYLRKLVLKK